MKVGIFSLLAVLSCISGQNAFRIERQAVTEALEIEPTEPMEPGEATLPSVIGSAGLNQQPFANGPISQAGVQSGAGPPGPGQAAVPGSANPGAEIEVETPELEGPMTTAPPLPATLAQNFGLAATQPQPPSLGMGPTQSWLEALFYGPQTTGNYVDYQNFFQQTVGPPGGQQLGGSPTQAGPMGANPGIVANAPGLPTTSQAVPQVNAVDVQGQPVNNLMRAPYQQAVPPASPLTNVNRYLRTQVNRIQNFFRPDRRSDFMVNNVQPGPFYQQGQISARSDGVAVDVGAANPVPISTQPVTSQATTTPAGNNPVISRNIQQAVNPNNQQAVNPNIQQAINQNNQQTFSPNNQQAVNPNNQQAIDQNNQQAVNPNNQQAVNPNNQQAVNQNNQQPNTYVPAGQQTTSAQPSGVIVQNTPNQLPTQTVQNQQINPAQTSGVNPQSIPNQPLVQSVQNQQTNSAQPSGVDPQNTPNQLPVQTVQSQQTNSAQPSGVNPQRTPNQLPVQTVQSQQTNSAQPSGVNPQNIPNQLPVQTAQSQQTNVVQSSGVNPYNALNPVSAQIAQRQSGAVEQIAQATTVQPTTIAFVGIPSTQGPTAFSPISSQWVFQTLSAPTQGTDPIRGRWVLYNGDRPVKGTAPIVGQWQFEPAPGQNLNGAQPIRGEWFFQQDAVQPTTPTNNAAPVGNPSPTQLLPENTSQAPTSVPNVPQINQPAASNNVPLDTSAGRLPPPVVVQPSNPAPANPLPNLRSPTTLPSNSQTSVAPNAAVNGNVAGPVVTSAPVANAPSTQAPPPTEPLDIEPTEPLEVEPTAAAPAASNVAPVNLAPANSGQPAVGVNPPAAGQTNQVVGSSGVQSPNAGQNVQIPAQISNTVGEGIPVELSQSNTNNQLPVDTQVSSNIAGTVPQSPAFLRNINSPGAINTDAPIVPRNGVQPRRTTRSVWAQAGPIYGV